MSPSHPPPLPTVPLLGGGEMPVIGLGTWRLSGAEARRTVGAALEIGYRLIDTATMYGNEADVGAAIRASGVPRQDVFLTTKVRRDDVGRERRMIEASLTALGVDHVDLWLIHWPPAARQLVPMWEALIAARDDGLAAAIGVSNHSLDQIDRLTEATGERPAVNQIPWSPGDFDAELRRGHRERSVVLEGYSPLKHTDLGHPTLARIADAHGVSPAQVVLRWHVEHEVVTIPKSSSPARLAANLDVVGFTLTDDERQAIDALGRPPQRRG